jgi:Opioid growth factor receptor (OGFr) conserved region.
LFEPVTQGRVVSFYSGGADHRGRTLDHILAWPDDELEAVHDYIQWVFPTVTPSAVNRSAPLVTDATIGAFAARAELRTALRRSLDRMLSFYGLRRTTDASGGVRIEIDASRFSSRAREWLHPGNHNHLRLTRIMQSLSALGLAAEARALQRCLTTDVYEGPGRNRITGDTYDFWLAAVQQ